MVPTKDEAVSTFLHHIIEVPYDLWLPNRGNWVGLRPKPQWHVQVVYHGASEKLLRQVVNQDQRLFLLREKLSFQLDSTARQLHVSLASQ